MIVPFMLDKETAKKSLREHFKGKKLLPKQFAEENHLDEIKAESDKQTYILVAHNGIARVVQSYFTDMTNEEYAAFGVKNCAVVRYDFTMKVPNSNQE